MIEEQLEELVARDELTLPATWKGGWARPAAGQHQQQETEFKEPAKVCHSAFG